MIWQSSVQVLDVITTLADGNAPDLYCSVHHPSAVEAVEEDCDLVTVEAKSAGYIHEQHESLFAWALSPLSKLPTSTACSSVERSGV
jgi:hypothetical protein